MFLEYQCKCFFVWFSFFIYYWIIQVVLTLIFILFKNVFFFLYSIFCVTNCSSLEEVESLFKWLLVFFQYFRKCQCKILHFEMTNCYYFCRNTASCKSQGLAFVKHKLSIQRRMHQLGFCSFLHYSELETAFFPNQTEDYEEEEDEVADGNL